jgi:hypothetical protein
MPTDDLAARASSIQAGPGTYAVLLGSGVSAASGVQSGWNVAIDLVQRLAALRGEGTADDPIKWYTGLTGGDPDYSELLSTLAPSSWTPGASSSTSVSLEPTLTHPSTKMLGEVPGQC